MSDRVLQSVKFALLGAGVGTVTATAADKIYGALLPMIAPPGGAQTTRSDYIGRTALALVCSSAMTAFAVYGGEQLMVMMGAENDPLAGVLFYHVCLGRMSTANITPNIIRSAVNNMLSPADSSQQNPPPPSNCPKPGGCMK